MPIRAPPPTPLFEDLKILGSLYKGTPFVQKARKLRKDRSGPQTDGTHEEPGDIWMYWFVDLVQALILFLLLKGESIDTFAITVVLAGCVLCFLKLKRSLEQHGGT